MAHKQSVLIISQKDVSARAQIEAISDRLAQTNLPALSRELEGTRLNGLPAKAPSAILLYFPNLETDDSLTALNALIRKLKQTYNGSNVPMVATIAANIDTKTVEKLTSIIFMPAHPAQIAQRMSSVIRMGGVARELSLRVKTLSAISQSNTFDQSTFDTDLTNLQSSKKPMRVLFIGKATTEFMTIMNSVQNSNVEIIAAFTSFTAFDYLHDQSFDAVIINAQRSHETAFTITSTMRRNSKLYHVPSLALIDSSNPIDSTLAFDSGINDILVAGAPSEEIAGRILELANYHRTLVTIKSVYSGLGCSNSLDPETGVFNAAFFQKHLQNSMAYAEKNGTPISVAVVKIEPAQIGEPSDQTSLPFAILQIGAMIKNIVRVQDCAARLSTSQFAIIFPNQTESDVEHISARIKDIIDGTAFDGAAPGFKVDLKINVLAIQKNIPAPVAKSA